MRVLLPVSSTNRSNQNSSSPKGSHCLAPASSTELKNEGKVSSTKFQNEGKAHTG